MNLNQVRLLEACHKYLIDKTNTTIKDELSKDKLVFSKDSKLITFNTYYKKSGNYSFLEYKIGTYEVHEKYNSIDVEDIYRSLNLKEGEVGTLKVLTDINIVRTLIFDLLCQVDFSIFSEMVKSNNIVYNWHQLSDDQILPFYNLENTESLTFVSII